MGVFLDANISTLLDKSLSDLGHDVLRVLPDPGDSALLQRSSDEKCVVITLDKDFGELAVLHQQSHAGIVRLVGMRAVEQAEYAAMVRTRYETELAEGAILTVSRDRIRLRISDR